VIKEGDIYLAEYENENIGSVALDRVNQDKYALTMMGQSWFSRQENRPISY